MTNAISDSRPYSEFYFLIAFAAWIVLGVFFSIVTSAIWFIKRRAINSAKKQKKNPLTQKNVQRLFIAQIIFLAISVICYGAILVLISTFDYYHWVASWLLTTLIFFVLIFINLPLKRSQETPYSEVDLSQMSITEDSEDSYSVPTEDKKSDHSLMERIFRRIIWETQEKIVFTYKWWLLVILFGILIITFFPSFMTAGVCICDKPYEFSTRFSRMLLDSTCPAGVPCHVYLMHPSSDSMIVIFHTPDEVSNPSVRFDSVSHENDTGLAGYSQAVSARTHTLDYPGDITRRIHWAELTGLSANTVYYFRAGYGTDASKFSAERKFLTAPSGNEPYVFVTGGDTGILEETREIMKVAASLDPLFVMIGGDISYSDDFKTCYRRWDHWIDYWEDHMVTSQGYTIPMILSLGNHEGGGFMGNKHHVPFYMHYFIQDFVPQGKSPYDMPSYNSHLIGNSTLILSLDTNVISSVTGEQLDWLANQLDTYQDRKYKFAQYHAPMYPTVRPFDDMQVLRDAWLDLFDSHKMTIGFENHDHTYKRSKILKNNEVSTQGTLYVGDGCMGLAPRSASKRWYHEAVAAKVFVLRVAVNDSIIAVDAYDVNGDIFDSGTQVSSMP